MNKHLHINPLYFYQMKVTISILKVPKMVGI
jgi:hypothetical protein